MYRLGTRFGQSAGLPMRPKQGFARGWCLASLLVLAVGTAHAGSTPDIELFTREGCPRCVDARRFLANLAEERPALRIVVHDVGRDPAALARLEDLAGHRKAQALALPAFWVGGQLIIGFRDAETTGNRIRAMLSGSPPEAAEEPEDATCPPGSNIPCTREARPTATSRVELPLFGTVNVQGLGLPLFTLLIGLADGFNPCAMWVLLFLLSILVNLHDRLKMALIGGTFVAVSGAAYFAFMAAWLNVFLLIGYSRTVQVILGAVAVLIGFVNSKDFLAPGRGLSLSIPERVKPGLYARMRRVVYAEHLFGALAGATVLAVLVNVVELLCTAGLPAVYTQVLSARPLPGWQYYAYLLLYNVAYMLDDSLMLVVAVVTLSRYKLQERGGRWLKLVSGLVMLALGFALIVRPGWIAGSP